MQRGDINYPPFPVGPTTVTQPGFPQHPVTWLELSRYNGSRLRPTAPSELLMYPTPSRQPSELWSMYLYFKPSHELAPDPL